MEPATLDELDRELARREFSTWLPLARPYYTWDWKHLVHIQEHLQAVADNEIQNLAILCPPQHGKSELSTISFPSWLLFREPKLRLAIAAYNQELANKFSRHTIRIAREWVDIASDRSAVQEWETIAGGGLRAVGIGAGLTGNPVDIGVIDDPIKDATESESLHTRDQHWDWYTSVFNTRNPKHKILTLTPWHEDGLQGRILNSAEGKSWTVVRLPALAEDGDPLGRPIGTALCEERRTLDELLMEQRVNPRVFEALYQCNPTPREGSFFKVTALSYARTSPDIQRKVRAWDVGSSPDGDFTAGVLLGVDDNGRYWVLDVQRFKATTDERNRRMLETAVSDGKEVSITVPEDPGAAGKDSALMYIRLFAGYKVKTKRPTGAKHIRAEPISAQIGGGNVTVLERDWTQAFVEELRQFRPDGKSAFDDQVDALADSCSELGAAQWDYSYYEAG